MGNWKYFDVHWFFLLDFSTLIQHAQSRMNWALSLQTWKFFSLKDIIWHLINRCNSYHFFKGCILFHYVYIKNYLGALDCNTFQKLQFIFFVLTGKARFPLRLARIRNVFLSPGIKNMLQAVQKREVQISLNSRCYYILINSLLQDTEWCWRRLLSVPRTARRSNQSILRETSHGCSLEGLIWSQNSNTLATWCEGLTHLKRPWCWDGAIAFSIGLI